MSPALVALLDDAAVRTLDTSAEVVDAGEPDGLVDQHERLAAVDVLLACVDGLLGDLGEHGFLNQEVTRERAEAWLGSAQRWVELSKSLRAAGADAGALLAHFNRDRVIVVSSREWLDGVVRGVRWRSRPEWLARVFERAVESDEEE